MTRSILTLRNVTKRFRGLVAINGISLELAEGSISSLIGPNGAGKSTLFNLVCGYLLPSAGEIHFQERRIDGLPTERIARLGVARAFQIAKPFPELSVLDNVRIGSLFGRAGPRDVGRITDAALATTGLDALSERPALSLTVGYLRRLELARAIAARPLLLLADEPCAGLNATETEEIVDILRKVRDQGVTVFLVEHDMATVMRISDRIVVIDAGAKIADGDPDAVKSDPRVIAAYLGTPAEDEAGA
jgi:ABC-type branched-subunit amino acid transport system ATPase component